MAPKTEGAQDDAVLLTISQAAAVLAVPEAWLRKKVSGRSVPHTRLGKHVRFTSDHLRAIIAIGEQPVLTTPTISRQGLSARARRAHLDRP
jgi:excisionase family DNA binding protein